MFQNFRPVTIALAMIVSIATSCARPAGDGTAFTLYRDSITNQPGEVMRIHVATFDAAESDAYNMENCETARDLFKAQPKVRVRYWCEKGRFRR